MYIVENEILQRSKYNRRDECQQTTAGIRGADSCWYSDVLLCLTACGLTAVWL